MDIARSALLWTTSLLVASCTSTSENRDAAMDTVTVDSQDESQVNHDAARDIEAAPPRPASTEHCTYEPLGATAHAGTTVSEGNVRAGTGEVVIDMPVGTVLGGFQSRANRTRAVDRRDAPSADVFVPSIGIETRSMARALAITAGDETVVLVKLDLPLNYESLVFEIEDALGPEFRGKVIVATSHSHASPGQFTANPVISLGLGRYRPRMYLRVLAAATQAAREALSTRRDASLGFAHDGAFDPTNEVSRDRRPQNDSLAGGPQKDHDLFVLRVDDRATSLPLAILPIFGVHGTVLSDTNAYASTEVTGAVERVLEEHFDHRVLVMHLQGAAGDVSPGGDSMTACEGIAQCSDLARLELVGHRAKDSILAAWTRAGTSLRSSLAMESVTRSVALGPDWRTFSIRRDRARLEYAPFVRRRLPDGLIFDSMGVVLSPIDEFNAIAGAGLCGADSRPLVPMAALPGVAELAPYRSCIDVERGALFVFAVGNIDPEETPVCASTRTNLTALRIGDFMLATLPGEPVTLLAQSLRARSPVGQERTAVIGYAQGHMGYLLTPEDWLRGGYEPNINLWGPLEGEYLVEQSAALMALAMTPTRENAAVESTRLAYPSHVDMLAVPQPSPTAGTIPREVPAEVFARGRPAITTAQPNSRIPRLQTARFVFLGEDPMGQNPTVVLERESAPGSGTFAPVTRHSSRPVSDGELLLSYTPQPLIPAGATPRAHYWVVEWQAVAPMGAALGNRAGTPLGNYRFRASGSTWSVTSRAFEVTPATLDVTATRGPTALRVQLRYNAPDGWRLLTTTGPQNRPLPLANEPVTLELSLEGEAMPRRMTVGPTDALGSVSVTLGMDTSRVRTVRAIDRFDNEGSLTLP
ncbi:MAG: neutral/alkaline non-lysosomal ceramidase N-terminal domain-containing protein [Deltaproteobacteria bacterium]|nr:neutral/alkaline non-lysosomal ceramidase N-terminal domain-containing protein [Deltaproteobacteria bacterium]